jgi:hypothetical protein
LTALACNLVINLTSTPAPAAPVLPTDAPTQAVMIPAPAFSPPPVVEPPAAESSPTPPPPAAPTDSDPVLAQVQEYYSRGYLPYEGGKLTSLPDFSKIQPESVIHDFTRTRVEAQDFALWADVELNSAGGEPRYPNYTGCGFAYRVQNNSAGYTAILTNTYVRMGACSSGMRDCELFGTIYGDGKVEVGNKTSAKFTLIVSKDRASVLVDDVLIGKYALFTAKLLGIGEIYFDAVSNYSAGYWTTCKMTNVKLWESLP